jgi:hypothetical protein
VQAEPQLRLWVCTDHEGFFPVGTASVVVAANEAEARQLLQRKLEQYGLSRKPFTLRELALERPAAHVLADGNY